MNQDLLHALLTKVRSGDVDVEHALEQLKELPYENIDFARIDHHRQLRTGMPEVVFGENKIAEHIARIVEVMARRGSNVLVTRVDAAKAAAVDALLHEAQAKAGDDVPPLPEWSYDTMARTLALRSTPFEDRGRGEVAVVAAGTSDLPVAREALITAQMMDNHATLLTDVGVAGLHRLLDHRERIGQAEVVIAVAGMEGALPGVLAGLIDRPIIGVPVNVGYGTGKGGFSALLTMLNSCAPGLTVVNIDNGYGAAAAASQINRAR